MKAASLVALAIAGCCAPDPELPKSARPQPVAISDSPDGEDRAFLLQTGPCDYALYVQRHKCGRAIEYGAYLAQCDGRPRLEWRATGGGGYDIRALSPTGYDLDARTKGHEP